MDSNSRFYRPDQNCAYHSNGVRHDIKASINLKHNIQDLIYQKVVFLHIVALNVNSNPLPNNRVVSINMIKTYDDWCKTKTTVLIAHEESEKVADSFRIT